jgi:hypothetical protein
LILDFIRISWPLPIAVCRYSYCQYKPNQRPCNTYCWSTSCQTHSFRKMTVSFLITFEFRKYYKIYSGNWMANYMLKMELSCFLKRWNAVLCSQMKHLKEKNQLTLAQFTEPKPGSSRFWNKSKFVSLRVTNHNLKR